MKRIKKRECLLALKTQNFTPDRKYYIRDGLEHLKPSFEIILSCGDISRLLQLSGKNKNIKYYPQNWNRF